MSTITDQLRAALAQAAREAEAWDARTKELVDHFAGMTAEQLRDEVLADPERFLKTMRSLAARPQHPCTLVTTMERTVGKALQAVEVEARLRASDDALARLLANQGAVSPLARIFTTAIRPSNDRPRGDA